MSATILHAPLEHKYLGPASTYVLETREAMLEYDREELATLRFSMILTARWAASEDAADRRGELRADLEILRRHYDDKIDDLAMTFGVDLAMKIKEEVERSVVVPHVPIPPAEDHDSEHEGCSAEDESGYHDI